MRRYMKDIALGVPVIGYNQFIMLPDNPIGDKVPASEIKLTGNIATFMSGGLHYTVVDGGEGLANDSIVVNDGIRKHPVSLFDGDITISNTGITGSLQFEWSSMSFQTTNDIITIGGYAKNLSGSFQLP